MNQETESCTRGKENKMKFETRDEWRLWRKKGIGGSDAAAVMGVSKWMSPFDLYQDKIDPNLSEDNNTFITQKGNDMEDRILKFFCLSKKLEMKPAIVVNKEYPFLRASLDAATEDMTEIGEVKLMGKEDWTALKEHGKIPDHYYPQCIHNLTHSGAKVLHFIAYLYEKGNNDGEMDKKRLAYVAVHLKDHVEYAEKLFKACCDFWLDNVMKRVAPPLIDSDYKMLGESEVVKKFVKLKEKIKEQEAELEVLEKQIKEKAETLGHTRYKCSNVRIRKEERQGSVEYAKIPELKALDKSYVDSFRKKGSSYWKIDIIKGGENG